MNSNLPSFSRYIKVSRVLWKMSSLPPIGSPSGEKNPSSGRKGKKKVEEPKPTSSISSLPAGFLPSLPLGNSTSNLHLREGGKFLSSQESSISQLSEGLSSAPALSHRTPRKEESQVLAPPSSSNPSLTKLPPRSELEKDLWSPRGDLSHGPSLDSLLILGSPNGNERPNTSVAQAAQLSARSTARLDETPRGPPSLRSNNGNESWPGFGTPDGAVGNSRSHKKSGRRGGNSHRSTSGRGFLESSVHY